MGKAGRNARKQMQREEGVKYQHPTRNGIPYGKSKPWSIDREIAEMHRGMDAAIAIAEAAPDLWRSMSGRTR